MKDLKVGDRVRVYAACDEDVLVFEARVVKPDGHAVIVEDDKGCRSFWHRKQLRKLVKKERRRVWLEQTSPGCEPIIHWMHPGIGENIREFVEVGRPKK